MCIYLSVPGARQHLAAAARGTCRAGSGSLPPLPPSLSLYIYIPDARQHPTAATRGTCREGSLYIYTCVYVYVNTFMYSCV